MTKFKFFPFTLKESVLYISSIFTQILTFCIEYIRNNGIAYNKRSRDPKEWRIMTNSTLKGIILVQLLCSLWLEPHSNGWIVIKTFFVNPFFHSDNKLQNQNRLFLWKISLLRIGQKFHHNKQHGIFLFVFFSRYRESIPTTFS